MKTLESRAAEVSRAMGALQRYAKLWHDCGRDQLQYPNAVEELGSRAVAYTRALERLARAERKVRR